MTNNLAPFRLEEYLATREFSSNFMFCASDLESRTIKEVLDLLPSREKENFLDLSLAYTLPEGSLELRQEISSPYENLNSDNVLCFAGAEEAIYSAANVLLDRKDHAITLTPCYQSLGSVAKSICDTSELSIDLIDGKWTFNIEKLVKLIKPNTKVIFINFPHNPTGFIPPIEIFQSIMDVAKQNDIIVFSDEVYRGIEFDPNNRLPSA
ncbi:MAG: aminotransferase class I/II-fold pyridoxal phosphate-dependent enzyme [Oligoflexales bacterium]